MQSIRLLPISSGRLQTRRALASSLPVSSSSRRTNGLSVEPGRASLRVAISKLRSARIFAEATSKTTTAALPARSATRSNSSHKVGCASGDGSESRTGNQLPRNRHMSSPESHQCIGSINPLCVHSEPWLLRDPFVDARGIQVGKIEGLFIRACYPVNRVNGAGHAPGSAEEIGRASCRERV